MYKYNIKASLYETCKIGIKIPANFMSIEIEDGRILISGGGEPGKAKKSCFEFTDSGLISRADMISKDELTLSQKQRTRICTQLSMQLVQPTMNRAAICC